MKRADGMEHFNIRMLPELFDMIERFAFEHKFRSRASAARHLIVMGLRAYQYEVDAELESGYAKRGAAVRSTADGSAIPPVDSVRAA